MEKSDILSFADYYQDDGARELSHKVKSHDLYACTEMARIIAEKIRLPANAVLIPVPSRHGYATNNLTICTALAKITGSKISDCLSGKARESLYALKKSGQSIPADFLHITFNGPEPDGALFLFDAVVDSGATMQSCRALFKTNIPTPFTYAMTGRNELMKASLTRQVDTGVILQTELAQSVEIGPAAESRHRRNR